MNIKVITIRNGGLEQGLFAIAKEEGLLSKEDEERLNNLERLPQDRIEVMVDGVLLLTRRIEE